MGDDFDLRDFDRTCRLFPLPGVVLFPHTVRPLHIFEPRYRQMTEDALATDRLITMVQIKPGEERAAAGRPPIEEIGCLGKILTHERLPDGRFNFLLLGLRRVRLIRELPSTKLYRLAEAELIDDEPIEGPEDARRDELVRLFKRVAQTQSALDSELESLLEAGLPLGPLTDIVAHALGLPPGVKQAFLADCRVASRADGLIDILHHVADREDAPPRSANGFPPSFSEN